MTFGDPESGLSNTSNESAPSHSFSDAGIFTITAIVTFPCRIDTIVESIDISSCCFASLTDTMSFCLSDSADTLLGKISGGIWSGIGIIDSINGVFDPQNVGAGTSQIIYTVCGESDTAIIKVFEDPEISYTQKDTGCTTSINIELVSGINPVSYNWSHGPNSSSVFNLIEGVYSVIVENGAGCNLTEVINIDNISTCEYFIYVPNAFSPNGDLKNDFLSIIHNSIKRFKLSVFDRRGNKVYETNDLDFNWKGDYKRRMLQSGVLSYYLEAESIKENFFKQSGTITLEK